MGVCITLCCRCRCPTRQFIAKALPLNLKFCRGWLQVFKAKTLKLDRQRKNLCFMGAKKQTCLTLHELLPGTPSATLPLKPATIALKVGYLAFQVVVSIGISWNGLCIGPHVTAGSFSSLYAL